VAWAPLRATGAPAGRGHPPCTTQRHGCDEEERRDEADGGTKEARAEDGGEIGREEARAEGREEDRGDAGTGQEADGGGPDALRDGCARGKLDVTMHGERLEGAFTMVRTGSARGERASWLLIKRTDAHADRGRDIVAEVTTSVESGRTMDEIARGDRVWHSNRAKG
jgi:bifunctional non-homologous end joining protein LigD